MRIMGSGMKITLELPDALARRFRAAVPNGQRSKVIAELLSKRLMGHEDRLERAAKKKSRPVRSRTKSSR